MCRPDGTGDFTGAGIGGNDTANFALQVIGDGLSQFGLADIADGQAMALVLFHSVAGTPRYNLFILHDFARGYSAQ